MRVEQRLSGSAAYDEVEVGLLSCLGVNFGIFTKSPVLGCRATRWVFPKSTEDSDCDSRDEALLRLRDWEDEVEAIILFWLKISAEDVASGRMKESGLERRKE